MRNTLTGLLTAGALALALQPAAAQQVKWNLADAYPATEFMNVNMQKWVDDVKASTGGNMQVTAHYGGALFKNPDIKRAVQTGQAELGTQLMQNYGAEKALLELDGIPFLVNSYDEAAKLWEISKPYIEKYMLSQDLKLLYAVPWPSQGFFFKKEVNSFADLQGVRQRAYNPMTSRLAQLMNTIPTSLQITDLAQAMATGTAQAFNTSPTTAVVFKVWEFSSHYYATDAWLPKQMVFVNAAAFSKLPAAYQKAMTDQAAIAEKRGWDMSREAVATSKAELVAKGMKVVLPGPKLAEDMAAAGKELVKEFRARNDADANAVLDAFLKAVGRS